MRYKARLTSGVILLLVMQLVLRSGAPVLGIPPFSAGRSVPTRAASTQGAGAAQPALGWSDLAIVGPHVASWPPSALSLGPLQASGVHQFFVPFDDRNLWALFAGKASCHGLQFQACLPLVSRIFVTAGSDGTIYYYDHWEDGYDQDPLVPSNTTMTGVLGAGDTTRFESNIFVAQIGQGPPYYHDGRDRVTIVGEDANVVRWANAGGFQRPGGPACSPAGGGGWPDSSGWLAAAWEVLEVADWGTEYHATVGEDLDYSAGVPDDHDYAGLEIMAAQNDTAVYYRGAQVAVLGTGETFFVDGANDGPGGGGVDSSHDITATVPVQVQMMTGACSIEVVSAHGYTLQPRDVWDTVYWAPVPGFWGTGNVERPNVDTDIYLHNPDLANAISVTVTSGISETILSIPPNGTVSVLNETNDVQWPDLAASNHGTHIASESPFWGLSVIDSATNRTGDGQDWDWGYSLVPQSKLSSQIVVGYAPGNPQGLLNLGNGNLAFVVAVTDTVLYVDLDQDGQPDPFDINGDGDSNDNDVWGVPEWDEGTSGQGVPVRARQVLRVGDPVDLNLEGARIYSTQLGHQIAAAWGQDPTRADPLRYLDLGYTLLPLAVSRLTKTAGLAVDADGSGGFSPGDTITYTLGVRNNGMGTMNDVVFVDSLPYTYTEFVVGSLRITTPPPVRSVEYHNGSAWGTAPISDAQMLRITWPYLEPQQAVTVTFLAVMSTTIPPDVDNICNHGVVGSGNTDPVSATVCTPWWSLPDARADVVIVKSDYPDPVGTTPGDRRLLYTLSYSNRGPSPAANVVVSDTLPPEVIFDTATPPQAFGPNPLVWNLGELAAGQSGTITVAVTVTAETWAGKTFTNTACIDTDTPEISDDNCASEPTTVVTQLAIAKRDDPDPGVPGEPLTYTLTYRNNGPFVAREVVITDTLPDEVTYGWVVYQPEGWSDPPTYTVGPPAVLMWYTPTLAPGATGAITYVVTAHPDVSGRIVNYACISWNASDNVRAQRCTEQPTAARVLYFRARPLSQVILLEWETAWEVDTYGFYLLRSASDRLEDAHQIAFVPAAGHGASGGAIYSYRDRNLESGRVYTYWLVEVDTSDRRTVYRPVSAAAFPELRFRVYMPLVWRRQ